MLPTLVIGLREGLEAALIVGIVAAFLRANGRPDLLKWVWTGVVAAVALCLGVGIALEVASENLPYRQQEGLETVIALVAVAMVTYMVVWMRRHAGTMKAQLEGAAGAALANGSAWALVGMAFLAVVREGFETAVFLVAAFNESADPRTAATGALIGIVIACAIGWSIYQGGLRINLARFFRFTGVVLVFVAAGLVASAVHSAHEAGWITFGQQLAFDLTWLVERGSVQSSLLTGLLGLQPEPTAVEVAAWLLFLVPVLTFVLWPARRQFPRRAFIAGSAVVAVGAAVSALVLVATQPAEPDVAAPVELVTPAGALRVVFDGEGDGSAATAALSGAALGDGAEPLAVSLSNPGTEDRAGRPAVAFVTAQPVMTPLDGGTAVASLRDVAELNGGRLPLGVNADTDPGDITVVTSLRREVTVWTDAATGVVLDAEVATTELTIAELSAGPLPLGQPQSTDVSATEDGLAMRAAVAEADEQIGDDIERFEAWERLLAAIAAAAALCGLVAWLAGRSRAGNEPTSPERGPPVGHDAEFAAA
jgi:high-affinity iron transporter